MDHPKTDRRFGDLFKWHLAEEIEHRHVAYDIYDHLYGDYFFRVKMCWVAQTHIWSFILDCMKIMSPVDTARFDKSYKVSMLHRFIMTVAVVPMFLKTYTPWYTPYRLAVPNDIQELSRKLTEAAKTAT